MIAFVASLLVAQVNAAQPVAPPPSGCVEEVHGAFDFWVGEWDVFPNGQETQVARSLIERLYGGCAIRENWMPFRGTGGGSLTSLDPGTGRWHQTWTGSSPGRVEFEGGPISGGMVLSKNCLNIDAGNGGTSAGDCQSSGFPPKCFRKRW